jgi:hypothetical protein
MEPAMEGLWSALPPDILERVLSFVPVPSLCRFRAVCQGWRELLRKPSFHDLCDRNGKKDKYLFVSRYLASGSIPCELNHTYRDTVSCTQLFISNPVTKTRRELPAPPIPFWN